MNPNSFNQHHQGSHPGSSSQQGGHPGQGPGPGGGPGGQGISPAMLNAFQKQQQMSVNPAQLMGMGGMGGIGGMSPGMGGMGGGMGGIGGGMANISGMGGGMGGMGGINMANIGGMNNMGMSLNNMGMGGINPSQLMSSSSSSSIQGDHHGHPGLQPQHSGGSMGGAGINPAALSGSGSVGGAGSMQRGGGDPGLLPSFPHIPHVVPPNHAGQMGMSPGSGSGPQPGQGGPGGGGGGPQINVPAALNAMGIPRERFMAMSHEQKQALMSRYVSLVNQRGGGGGNPQMMPGGGGGGMNQGMGGGNLGGGGGMGDMIGMGGNMMGGIGGMGGIGNMSNMSMGMMNGMGGIGGGLGGGNMGLGGGGIGNMNMGNIGGMGHIGMGNMSNAGGVSFDRPSSAASSHSNNAQTQQQGQAQQGNQQGQQGSRMPPPPLPSNSAGIQRPGTVPPGTPNMGNIQLGQQQHPQSQSQGQQGQGGHGHQGQGGHGHQGHPGQQGHQGGQGYPGQQGQGGQQQGQGQQISRPGTSLSHRSPVIPGPSGGNIPGMERPGSRMAQRQDMNGFNHQAAQQQAQAQSQSRSASRAGSLAPQGQGQPQSGSSNQGGHGQGQAPGPSISPPVSAGPGGQGQGGQNQQNPMMSPYRGAKRKLPGEGPTGAPPGNMQQQGMGMNQMGGMGMNMNMNVNMGMMGGMGMGGMGGGPGGVPGSPRIGPQGHGPPQTPSGLGPQQQQGHQQGSIQLNPVGGGGGGQGGGQGQMGPPILPRSVSGDGMAMNGARGSPRPGSSMGFRQGSMGPMGMSGMGGQGGMGPAGMGGGMGGGIPSGAVSGGMGMPGSSTPGAPHVVPIQPAPPQSAPGTPGPGGMSGMGVGPGGPMGMGGAGPQTPLRHGSLPPGASPGTPLGMGHPLAQGGHGGNMGVGVGGPQMGGAGPGRQGSLPPHGMMSPAGARGMGGLPLGMGGGGGGVPNMPGSPAPGGMPGGGLGGPMALGTSVSSGGIAPGITSGGTPAAVPPGALGASASVGGGPLPGSQGGTPTPGPQSAIPGAQAAALNNLPPLPAGVNLNPQTTQITPVPLLTSEKLIPPLSDDEISAIQEWMTVDKAHLQKVNEMQNRMLKEVRGPSNPLVGGFWWEKGGVGSSPNLVKWGRAPGPFSVALPGSWRDKRKRRKGREGLKLPRAIGREDAERVEQLVPVRIEFDVEHHKMRDTFVWNLSDPVVTPEIFAQSIVDDYGLAPSYHNIIVKSIQEQLSDYKSHSGLYDVDHDLEASGGVICGKLDEEEARWWETWRKSVKAEGARAAREFNEVSINGKDDDGADSEAPSWKKTPAKRRLGGGLKRRKKKTNVKVEDEDGDVSMLGDNEDEGDDDKENERVVSFDVDDEDEERKVGDDVGLEMKPMGLEEFKLDEETMHEDMRILIKLDIIVAAIKLDDQFEWDLDNPYASPEGFAEVYAQELGLSGEFKTAIAHSIREQVQAYQKSLFLVGHPSDGSAIQDEELKQSFLPSLVSGARPIQEVESFTPVLYQPSDAELERTEKERDKDLIKRRKRNTRGRRGIALPDREPIRTYRTPAIGFPELDAATLALAAAANAPVSRRAAAAAASLTIANMVASENGERAFVPQTLPSQAIQPQPTATPAKEKKPKGLFKAPSFPPSVLRPRAQVRAPTESTAADVSKMPTVPADSEAPMSSSPINTSLQDQRALKVMTAKRAKELEREAKEKEFVDGQHPNYIKGIWHCSNCGCPENIAIGRRKGPLGDKSQCGTCGKFWHRHRRPRPVEYNPDPDFHSGLKQKEIDAKTPLSKKKMAAAALRAQSTAISTPAAESEPQTPVRSNGGDMESSRKSPTPAGGDDRGMSPVSTSSSASEAPLAQKVKLNGSHSKNSASVSTPTKAQSHHDPPVSSSKVAPEVAHTSESAPPPASTASVSAPAQASASAPPSASAGSPNRPPPWLSSAMAAMMAKYPNDKFEVILRRIQPSSPPEWRLKCSDCPGKVYKPGPGETLSNFEVHLKNRAHRQSVNSRVHGLPDLAAPPASASAPSTEPAS